jgi:hypothetical protein
MSYPPMTFEDLAFLGFLTNPTYESMGNESCRNSSCLFLNTTVPTVRSRLLCILHTSSDITTQILFNQTENTNQGQVNTDVVIVNSVGEHCRSGYNENGFTISMGSTIPEETLFGAVRQLHTLPTGDNYVQCSSYVFLWGSVSTSHSNPRAEVSVLGCNDSIEALDVSVSLWGANLDIDPKYPPQRNETSSHVSSYQFAFNETDGVSAVNYDTAAIFAAPPNGHAFDRFFEMLTTSRYAIPALSLNDSTKTGQVIDAIRFQHGVFAAQYLDRYFRVLANSTNVTVAGGNDAVPYGATATIPQGRRRLVQDATTTRILEGSLAATLLLSLASWMLMRQNAILPRSPTSIASVLALVAGGNLLEEARRREGNVDSFDNHRFWMGWGPPNAISKRKSFGIWVIAIDRESTLPSAEEDSSSGESQLHSAVPEDTSTNVEPLLAAIGQEYSSQAGRKPQAGMAEPEDMQESDPVSPIETERSQQQIPSEDLGARRSTQQYHDSFEFEGNDESRPFLL